jgi:hypothetical protein
MIYTELFTVSVVFRGQILYRYYKRYLQFRLICDMLDITAFSTANTVVISSGICICITIGRISYSSLRKEMLEI